eukprot:TRINITY_DN68509_c0_g1_i1.p1 TRINITY_DN68509_c0_g1~~TRINITY_DN68509_c0_g1_i1.p1  ORF type:complete len:250 (+),score=42.12 TRINITY_DN68509_c0_g1_i1:68-817(+)
MRKFKKSVCTLIFFGFMWRVEGERKSPQDFSGYGFDGEAFAREMAFSDLRTLEEVRKKIEEEKKPAMVIVSRPSCPVCRDYLKSLNDNKEKVAELMKDFISVATDEGDGTWKAEHGVQEDYVPRTYFLDTDGNFLDIYAPRDIRYGYSFWEHKGLEKAMSKVLDQIAEAKGEPLPSVKRKKKAKKMKHNKTKANKNSGKTGAANKTGKHVEELVNTSVQSEGNASMQSVGNTSVQSEGNASLVMEIVGR